MNFIEFMKTNLSHVLPILIAGFFALAIGIERFIALYKTYPLTNLNQFFEQLTPLILSSKISDAVRMCEAHGAKPAAKVIKTALSRANLPETVIEDGIRIVVADASHEIMKRTSFLATIANVATLLGLFGTIAGLISSFEAVGHADPQQKSALLAAGISTAMNATMMGLAIAIPAMIAFSIFMNKSNSLVSEVESAGIRTLDLLKQRFYSTEEFVDRRSPTPDRRVAS